MKNKNLPEIASVFLKLGIVAFGGPAAHIAMMEEELVNKRKWMDRQHFLDLMGATNLIPGPNSTEMTMHCGYHRGGIAGLFTAGICFIFPAVLITGILAFFYVKYAQLPALAPLVMGIKAGVLSIIIGAIYKLGKKALKNWQLGVIGGLVIIASVLGLTEVLAILLAGVLGVIGISLYKENTSKTLKNGIPLMLLGFSGNIVAKVSTTSIFFIFLKVGAILFGSGYVLVAYLDGELVEKLGWLSRSQLLEAIAIGQFTPGPVLSTATFIGYQMNGVGGAIAATLGIFLPSFLFVWLLNPLVSKIRNSPILSGFLDGVNIGAVAIMVVVTFQLAQGVLIDWKSWLIAILSVIAFFGIKKINVFYIVIGSALLAYLLSYI